MQIVNHTFFPGDLVWQKIVYSLKGLNGAEIKKPTEEELDSQAPISGQFEGDQRVHS